MVRPRRHRRAKNLTFNRLLPNILTTFALCAGLTSIRLAIDGRFELAAIAILLAAVLDTLDGRVARLLKVTSPMGAQLDSLSDFVCFGVAPALLIYFWSISDAGQFGWAVVLIYAVCAALRLARFNVQSADETRPPWASIFFTGVPSPAGAGLALLPLFFYFETGIAVQDFPVLIGIWTAGAGLLMVSTLPTFSMKGVLVPARYLVLVLAAIGLVIAGMITATWLMLLLMGLLYLASIPLSWRRYQALVLRTAALREAALHRKDPVREAVTGVSVDSPDPTPAESTPMGSTPVETTDAESADVTGPVLSDRGVYPINSRRP